MSQYRAMGTERAIRAERPMRRRVKAAAAILDRFPHHADAISIARKSRRITNSAAKKQTRDEKAK